MAITIEKIIGSSEGNPDTGLTARNKINSNFQNLADAILNIQISGGSISFNNITDKPTTLAGYGITDAASVSHVHAFASLTNKPTTLLGYGIVDAANINHTHSFSVLTDKPTTLLGYGITEAYTKSQIDTYLALKLDKTTFNDLFEKVNIGTEANPIYAIEAKYNFYGLGEVSAYGVGSGGSGGGLIQTVYSYSNLGGTFLNSTLTDTFNAYTINQLASRINSLEGGSTLTFNTTGIGNAITSISKSGTVVTSVLGNSYLPLSGGTLSGRLYANITSNSDLGILNREDGNNDNWRGRIISQNATSNKSIFIGTYGNVGGVFSHNFSLDAWANLYVNTLDGTNGGEVRMPPNTYVGNNAVWHSGNLNNLSQLTTRNFSDLQNKPTTLSGYGITDASSNTHNHYLSTITDTPTDDWNLYGFREHNNVLPEGLTGSYNYGQLLSFCPNNAKFQMYVSHHASDGGGIRYRSGWYTDKKNWVTIFDSGNANISSIDWNAKDGYFNGTKLSIQGDSGNRYLWNRTGSQKIGFWTGGDSAIASIGDIVFKTGHAFDDVTFGLEKMRLSSTGNLTVSGNILSQGEITAYSTSDKRLKSNFNKLKGLDFLSKVKTYSFEWSSEALELNPNKGVNGVGVIAQELQDIDSSFVHKMYGNKYLGVDYNRFIPYLVSGINEIDTEVSILNKKINRLEKRISELEHLN